MHHRKYVLFNSVNLVYSSNDFIFFVINIFFFFSHITQHSIQNITNKTTDTYSTSQSPVKREGEREGQQKHKSHSSIQSRISNKKHCQASMVEGLAPPTRAVAHSHVTICRRLRIQYVFPHMCGVNQFCIIAFFAAVKPANNILFCIELIQRPENNDFLLIFKIIFILIFSILVISLCFSLFLMSL